MMVALLRELVADRGGFVALRAREVDGIIAAQEAIWLCYRVSDF